MTTYTLTLTEEQVEILGYALTKAWRREYEKACAAKPESQARQGCLERQHRIEELRNMLDRAPANIPART